MKELTLRSLLLLLFAMWAPVRPALYSNVPERRPVSSVEANCSAPPPSNFHAATASVSSITLQWTENTPGLYYWLSGADLTTGAPLPNVVTQGDTYTYTSLPYGHNFIFFIGASFCPQGPPGGKVEVRGSTIIISDIVLNIFECTPDDSREINVGESFEVVVPKSTSVPGQPLNNGYIAEFRYNFNGTEMLLRYGLVYNFNESTVYFEELEDPYSRYTLKAFNLNGLAGECCFGNYNSFGCNLPIFRITSVVPETTNETAIVELVFQQPVGSYKSCNQGAGTTPPMQKIKPGPVTKAEVLQKTEARTEKLLFSRYPSPNPFAESTRLEYQLQTDGPVAILLCDALGRKVRDIEPRTIKTAGRYETVIEGAGLPAGIYYLHLQTEVDRQVFPLVKQRE
ncbi:MAG: T9SS type A sorting domain-containing protein [Saprospirales bacterium]|jgi:hypothetical protein|nr:T9SS type A sorting domain-containing protein [Saprospirales bacterium]MBK8924213.1 T9SS type A sorting domain-containing protein [Saprospirales bacterium]